MHSCMWEYSHKGLKLAQLLGQHGVFLAITPHPALVHIGNPYGGEPMTAEDGGEIHRVDPKFTI